MDQEPKESPHSSPYGVPKGRGADALIALFVGIIGPMILAGLIGMASMHGNDIGRGFLSGSGPIAAIGCAVGPDQAMRRLFELPVPGERPKSSEIVIGVLWMLVSWYCAFALGRAL